MVSMCHVWVALSALLSISEEHTIAASTQYCHAVTSENVSTVHQCVRKG